MSLLRLNKGFWLGLVICLSSTTALANDSVATLDAGGIVLGKSDDIVMEKEDLLISEDKIRVSYVFRNTSKKPIETRIAFPVPEFPAKPEGDIGLDTESKNPMDFSVTIEGKKKKFNTEIQKKRGNIHITHHWVQTFPPKKSLAISHEYKPAVGGEAGFYFGSDVRTDRIKQYCIDDDLTKWIDKHADDGYTPKISPNFVHYVLKTGANWKGPIGEFRLTIKKKKASDKVSFCGKGAKKTNATTFVLEKTDFTPKDNLYVMFLHQNELSDQ